MHLGVVWMLIGNAAADDHAPAHSLYVQPAGLRPAASPELQTKPAAPPSVMTPPGSPEMRMPAAPAAHTMPATVESPVAQFLPPGMYTTSEALPIAEGPASPFGFLGGFAGGLAAGAALVYSLVKRTSQNVTAEAKKLELGALTSVAVGGASSAGAPNLPVVQSTVLAPYLAGGASLPAVLKQVTSGRAAMPAFSRQLRAINIGRGRRVVVNMKVGDEFAYGLPGGTGLLMKNDLWSEFDPWRFLENSDGSLKDKVEVYKLREAELTHGRVSMLASLGFIVQENFHPLFSGENGTAGELFSQLPIWLWAVVISGVGIAEAPRVGVGWAILRGATREEAEKKKANAYPGDLGFDPLGIKPSDPEEFRLMQEKELQHCRVAMLATAGFLAQESASGATWGAFWAQ